MSGIPVVIAENGIGIPVKPVEKEAVLLTVAENGIGIPIVVSDNGVPYIIENMPDPEEP